MKEFKYVITDNEGIHARPAGELVKLAKSFESSVMIEKEGKKADCKKIFGLMGLGAKKDHEVTKGVWDCDRKNHICNESCHHGDHILHILNGIIFTTIIN